MQNTPENARENTLMTDAMEKHLWCSHNLEFGRRGGKQDDKGFKAASLTLTAQQSLQTPRQPKSSNYHLVNNIKKSQLQV